MTIRIYGIKNCDTMKKAFAWLESRKIAYEFHDYKKEGAPAEKLKQWASQAGWEKLINSRGPTWRKIPETQRENLNQARALALLAEYPSAIRRPIVQSGSKLLIGFTLEEFGATLKR